MYQRILFFSIEISLPIETLTKVDELKKVRQLAGQ